MKKLDCLLSKVSNFPFIIFSILIIFFSHPLLGKEVQIKIMKVDSSPKIDGYLEQSFWDKIEPLKEFVQYDPYNGKPPSEKTFVYLAFDEDNLYVAFNCLDSQAKKIKGDLTPREQFSANDYVSIIIDTYYDKRNAYYFYLNPKGVQRDSPGDYLWKSGALINEDGWSAEFWIPFKSIRFPTGSSKPWGINFKRYIFRLKETDLLTNVGRDDVLLEKSALLTGLEGIRGGKNLEFFPYSGYRNTVSGEEKDSKLAAGIDAKYSITSNLNFDVTVSPDFSEVESDPFFYQLTPYEYYLMEKRPFFQEAYRYFGYELFYTKRIADPKFAFKLTGKEHGYTIGLIGALNKAEDRDQYLGVCNIKKDIFSLSSLTMAYSGYDTTDFTNHNAGANLDLVFSKKTSLNMQSYFAFNSDIENRKNGYHTIYFSHYPDQGFTLWATFNRIEKNYRPRAGFYRQTDFQMWNFNPGYSLRVNKHGIKKIDFSFSYRLDQDCSGQKVAHFFDPIWFNISSMKAHFFMFDFYFGKRKVQLVGDNGLEWSEDFFKNFGLGGYFSYSGSRYYTYVISLWLDWGPVYNRQFTEAYDGKAIDLWTSFELKPTSFLNLTLDLSYTKQNIRLTGEEIFEGVLTSGIIRWQISRYIYLSSYIQHDSHYKRVNLDLLLGIELGMGNLISLSYKGFYPFEGSPYENSARSFVIKASYLIRI